MNTLRQFNFVNSVLLLSLMSMVCANSALPKGEIHDIYPVIQLPETSLDGFHLNHLNVESDASHDASYPAELAYTFRYMEKDLRMELRKNTQLLGSDYREIRMDYEGVEKGGNPAESVLGNRINCYYHGYLSSDPNSLVAVSACRGLSGMIHAHGQMFSIEPDLTSSAPPTATADNNNANANTHANANAHRAHAPQTLATSHLAPHHQDVLQLTGIRHHLVVHDMDNLFNLPARKPSASASASAPSQPLSSTPTSAVFDRLFRAKAQTLSANFNANTPVPTDAPQDQLLMDEEDERELAARTENSQATFCGVAEMPALNQQHVLEPSEDENTARQLAEQRDVTQFLDQLVGNNRVDGSSVFNGDDEQAAAEAATEPTWRGVRLLIANDNALYRRHGDDVEAFSLAVANIVSRIYVQAPFQTRTFVKLVGQVTYTTKDPYDKYFYRNGDVSVTASKGLLNMFSYYQDGNTNLPSRTNMQLYSGLKFETTVLGLAGVGTMCDPKRSTAVCQLTQSTHALNAVVSAHEMGHNLGMMHDGRGNSCPKAGYVMASYAGSSLIFSRCSQQYYQRYMSAANRFCMATYRVAPSIDNRAPSALPLLPSLPTTSVLPRTTCGDGIVDASEQCDCGSSNCTGLDSCCDGLTCQLVAGAQCSANDACCTHQCTVVAHSEQRICRTSQGECDEEERCDGKSATCPLNAFKASGTVCSPSAMHTMLSTEADNNILASSGMCFVGECVDYASQCTSRGLFPCALGGSTSLLSPACGELYCAPSATAALAGECTATPLSLTDNVQSLNGVPCGSSSASAATAKQCWSGDCVASALIHAVQAVWVAGEWGSCSAACGGGQQARVVECRDVTSSLVVNARFCSSKQPQTSQACNMQHCHAVSAATATAGSAALFGWRSGAWSLCDVACGQGYQTRAVQCLDLIDGVAVENALCTALHGVAPAHYQFCKVRDCASGESPTSHNVVFGSISISAPKTTKTAAFEIEALQPSPSPSPSASRSAAQSDYEDEADALSVISDIVLAACPAVALVTLIVWCAVRQRKQRAAALNHNINLDNAPLSVQ